MSDGEKFTVEAARAAADGEGLATWVGRFLASPGSDNPELAEILSERLRFWAGPLELPLKRLRRLAGPPGHPVLCPVDEDDWDDRVDQMKECLQDGWEPAPVIVSVGSDGGFVLEDGNHRVESLRRAGRAEVWAVVGFETEADQARFLDEEPTTPSSRTR